MPLLLMLTATLYISLDSFSIHLIISTRPLEMKYTQKNEMKKYLSVPIQWRKIISNVMNFTYLKEK